MDVRIGVKNSPKELEVLLADDTDGDAVREHIDTALPTAAPCGSPTAGAASTACPSTRSPTSRSARATRGGASASAADPPDCRADAPTCSTAGCCSSPARAASARPPSPPRSGQLAAARGKRTLLCEVDAKGNLAGAFETGPTEFAEREIAPGLWAMSMDTEASLKEYLEPPAQAAAAVADGPAGPHVRLRGQRRAGGQGDPDRRQAVLRGPRAPLRPGGGRRPGVGPHRRPAGRARRPSATWCRSGTRPRPDRLDARHPGRPRPDRGGHRGHARGDAGERDPRAVRAAAAPRPRSTWPPWSSTGCCPSCSAGARRRCSGRCGSRTPAAAAGRGRAAGPSSRCSTAPSWP